MQRPRLALSVLVAATLCLPLVVGQPPEGTFLTRCNPSVTPTYDGAALSATNLSVCCMWTFPGASGTAGPLVRTGTCSDATTDTIALNNNTINSTQTSDFANCGNVRILDLSDNPIVLTNPNPLPFGFLTSLEVLKLKNVGPEGGKISGLTAITYPTYPATNLVKLKTLDLSNNAITTLPATFPTALSNLQTLDLNLNLITSIANVNFPPSLTVLKLTNAGAAETKISTLSNVVFPTALKLLVLEGNKITSITSNSFPPSLTHLSLKGNKISSIDGVTITLKTCQVTSDVACTLDAPDTALAKSVDLSGNLFTSIAGATFAGNIVKLTVGRGSVSGANKLKSLPWGASFPPSLTSLNFDVDHTEVWSSMKYCNGNGSTPAPAAIILTALVVDFDPTTCCAWGGNNVSTATDRPLERIGTCTSATYETNKVLDLKDVANVHGITRILPNAFSNCGSPEVLLLDNHKLKTLADVAFPPSLKILSLKNNLVETLSGLHALAMLKVLDLETNKIKSIAGVQFPTSLTHLSLKGNNIASIKDVTITLNSCTVADCTYPSTYSAGLFKSVDLSGNLFTSIAGATFAGNIVKLDLRTNPFYTLPIGATFPDSLTQLYFDDPTGTRWRSEIRCNSGIPDPFDPSTCCMWGGSNAGAPLERLGKCVSATGEIISLRKATPTARFVASPSSKPSQGITSIPANAFVDCGSPKVLEITDQPLASISNVTFPDSLRILDLGDNQLASLAGAAFPPLRFLNLGNNKLTSIDKVNFPSSLTHLDLAKNHLESLEDMNITLSDCIPGDTSGSLATACATATKIKTLRLQDNLITSLAKAKFFGAMITLNLDNNRISTLSGAGVVFPTTLTTLSLSMNKITSVANVNFPTTLQKLSLEGNKISSLSGMTFPASITELNLKNNKIASLAGVTIPSSISKLDLSVNPDLLALDFNINIGASQIVKRLESTDPHNLVLPTSIKCIPVQTIRNWVTTVSASTLGIRTATGGEIPECTWTVPRCNPTGSQCCVWVGSFLGAPVNRSGVCSEAETAIDLSDRGITALPPGAFENCGQPESLKLNKNRLSSMRLSDNRILQLPSSLTYLDLSENRIESLSGVTFNLTDCKLDTAATPACVDTSLANFRIRLNLENNLLTSLSGVIFKAESINLNLANNKIASLMGVTFPESTSKLDLSNNQIASLDDITFNFTGCKELKLNENEIASFSRAKFLRVIETLSLTNVNKKGLTSLAGATFDLHKCKSSSCTTTLGLHKNRITSLAGAKFAGAIDAMRFEDNQITSIAGATFHATKCRLIDLGHNRITSLAGATFAGAIGTLDLEKNEIKSLEGATFQGSIAILDLKDNQITSLAGMAFNFLKCDSSFVGDCTNLNVATHATSPGFANQIDNTQLSFPSINLANNKITSLAGANFAGSITTLHVVNNPTFTSLAGATFSGTVGKIDLTGSKLTSLVGIEKFMGITNLVLAATGTHSIPPQGLIGVTLPPKNALGNITGLNVDCIPSPASPLKSRLSVDYLLSKELCAPIFWTRCDSDATVEERCPNPPVTSPNTLPGSAWIPTTGGCVPTNTAQCCIWSQAFPGAPLVRDGVCENAVGGGIDLSGAQIDAIPSGAFDKIGSPRFVNLENNKLTSLGLMSLLGMEMPASLQALFLNDNAITSLAGVKFPASLQVLHLHRNDGLTCAPLPPALVSYSGPEACKIPTIPTTPPPSKAPATTARPPSPPSATPSPPAPAPVPVAKTDNFVQLVVSLPYTKASFDQDKQLKFRAALAASAGTTADNVEITSITEGRRRQGQGIKVENKIYAKDAASADKLSSTLGTGTGALDKINSELQKQGLEKSTGLDVVAANKSDNTGLIVGLVVGLGGGAIIIVAIAAYYLYVVKPAAQLPPKTRDLENAPVVAPSAPIVAPAASLGVPSPARMPAPSTLVFDAYDFTNWSKSGAPGYQTNQPGYMNQPQYGAMPRFNM